MNVCLALDINSTINTALRQEWFTKGFCLLCQWKGKVEEDHSRAVKLLFDKNMSFNWINLLLSGLLPSLVLMIVPCLFWRNSTFEASLMSYHCITRQDNMATSFDKNFLGGTRKAVRTLQSTVFKIQLQSFSGFFLRNRFCSIDNVSMSQKTAGWENAKFG